MKTSEKLSGSADNKKTGTVILAVIILLQLIYYTYAILVLKQGQHSDETWSYSIANYFKDEQVFEMEPGEGWISSDLLKDYITATDGERFDFAEVYKNSAEDLNPPLYYMLLHLICSFFPNRYSLWFAYSVNILSVIGIQIFIYLTGKLIFREKRLLPFVSCLFFAVCRGGMDSAIFLRMYCLLELFTAANVYFQLKVMHSEDDRQFRNSVIFSFVTCYLGFMTHSFFPMIGGTATFMVCLWLLFHKQIKRMFIHGFAMLGSLGLYALTFFPGVSHVLNVGDATQTKGASYPFITQFGIMRNYFLRPVTGLEMSYFGTYTHIYVIVALIVVIAIGAPLCFLFRNETWFRNMLGAVRSFFTEKKYIGLLSYDFVTVFLICLVYVAVCCRVVMAIEMGDYAERYVVNLYPLECVLFTMAAYWIFVVIKPIRRAGLPAALCVCVGLGLYSNVNHSRFLFDDYGRTEDLHQYFDGSKVQLVVVDNWVCVPVYPQLIDCEKFRPIRYKALKDDPRAILNTKEAGGDFYLVMPYAGYDVSTDMPYSGIIIEDPDNDIEDMEDEDEEIDAAKLENGFYTIGKVGVQRLALTYEDIRLAFNELKASDEGIEIEEICTVSIQGAPMVVYKVSA